MSNAQLDLFVPEELDASEPLESMENFPHHAVVQSYWKALHVLRSVDPGECERWINDIENDQISFHDFAKKVNKRNG